MNKFKNEKGKFTFLYLPLQMEVMRDLIEIYFIYEEFNNLTIKKYILALNICMLNIYIRKRLVKKNYIWTYWTEIMKKINF